MQCHITLWDALLQKRMQISSTIFIRFIIVHLTIGQTTEPSQTIIEASYICRSRYVLLSTCNGERVVQSSLLDLYRTPFNWWNRRDKGLLLYFSLLTTILLIPLLAPRSLLGCGKSLGSCLPPGLRRLISFYAWQLLSRSASRRLVPLRLN